MDWHGGSAGAPGTFPRPHQQSRTPKVPCGQGVRVPGARAAKTLRWPSCAACRAAPSLCPGAPMSTITTLTPRISTARQCPAPVRGQGAAHRQHRQRLRLHAAVWRAGSVAPAVRRPGPVVVLGFPCNQFAHQDPGSNEEIASFCQLNYGVSFPMMARSTSTVPTPPRSTAGWPPRRRACWAARPSSGTSPSSWSARTARWFAAMRRRTRRRQAGR